MPPEAVALNETVPPATGEAGVKVKSAAKGRGLTTRVWLFDPRLGGMVESVTARLMVKPAAEDLELYTCVTATSVVSVTVGEPSPKFQVRPYGVVPPVTVGVKVTVPPTWGAAGLIEKSTVNAEIACVTITV